MSQGFTQSNSKIDLSNSTENFPKNLVSILESLRPMVERIASVELSTHGLFGACLASSFVKAFEFVELTSRCEEDIAPFLTSSLRSIAEEIIVLNYLAKASGEDREFVIQRLMELELRENAEHQSAFFQKLRPFQRIIPNRINDSEQIKEDLQVFWQKKGWSINKSKHPMIPQIRQIAEKSEPRLFETVYDFIYRLSSNSVHFNAGSLLRLGWGVDKSNFTFSANSRGRYFLEICQTYGAYLLCLQLELFHDFLKPNPDEIRLITDLRRYLLLIRHWPEMVAFEEVNMPTPDYKYTDKELDSHVNYAMIMEGGFVLGTKRLLELKKKGISLSDIYSQ